MKELDLTQGSVPKVLLQFAVPFLIANVLQALYGGADIFVVGQYDDSASVAAVAIGSQVMQTLTGVHSPDERMLIPTVEKFWKHLLDILAHVPAKK